MLSFCHTASAVIFNGNVEKNDNNDETKREVHLMNKSAVTPDLKKLRSKKGWSQERAAETAGMSRSHYAMIESGKSSPGVKAAQRLGECFGFNWQDYFTNK